MAVFPCEPGGKKPLTERGFKDATTDQRKIRAWWRRWPEANVAAPTGKVMGAFVLDVDSAKGGLESLRRLEAEHGPLPETARVRTGGGGLHFYLRMPADADVRCSAGKLGDGLDTRGTHGYVLLPPSTTEAQYTWSATQEIAAAPPRILKKLRERPPRQSNGSSEYRASDIPETIGEGTRNDTLARIAGSLRCHGAEREDIEAELLRINRERCNPSLPDEETLRIAASISRYPKGTQIGDASPEVAAALEQAERILWSRAWSGMGDKSARDCYIALVKTARRYGTLVEDGVRVSIGLRPLALVSALSKKSAQKALQNIKDRGLIRTDNANRKDGEAGAYILIIKRDDPRAKVPHSTMDKDTSKHGRGGGLPLRAPLSAPRLRWSERDIKRLGKTCGALIDTLERVGGAATVGELADILGMKRPRDLKRRVVPALQDAGIVNLSGEVVSFCDEWAQALERKRERTGEVAAHTRDRERYIRQSTDHRARMEARKAGREVPAPVPVTEAEAWACQELEGLRRRARERKRFAREHREFLKSLRERRERARVVLSDPNTRPGAVYRTQRYGSNVDVLGVAMAAHEREPEAWRAWVKVVEAALKDLDGEVVGDAA